MAARSATTLRPQDEISHYRIIGPLGAGGMGEVYLAEDRSLERRVALKILPPDLVRNEERMRRFVLEARSASSLSHPAIVTIYEIGSDAVHSTEGVDSGPVHFISMELVTGRTLATLIHAERTPLKELLGYLAQAADGLARAHTAGIVHRDLKPGNIMVSADGFAKVLDFGLAKLTEPSAPTPDASGATTMPADATGAGIVVGTAGYMSPEQVQGRSVDHRSDVFSFGCILYEAATRRQPFAAATGVETMHRVLHDTPVPVEEIDAAVPAELRRVIRRCLAKAPDRRFQSMKDLAIELREIADEYDSLSASASSGSMSSGPLRADAGPRRAWRWAVVAAVAVAAGVALVWWSLRHAENGASSAPFQNIRTTVLTSRGDVQACVLSRDSRYLAYLFEAGGRTGLRVRQVATGSDVEIVPPTAHPLANPSFSPDGNYVCFTQLTHAASGSYTLYRVPSLGGAAQEVVSDVDSRAAFSPDGRQIAFWRLVPQDWVARLVVFDLDSRKETKLVTVPLTRGPTGAPDWSADGKHLAAGFFAATGGFVSKLSSFDLETGRERPIAELPDMALSGIAWLPDGSGLIVSGKDLHASYSDQLFMVSDPGGRVTRITNDFNTYSGISVSAGPAIAAVRTTQVSNLWIAGSGSDAPRRITRITSPENSPVGPVDADSDAVYFAAMHGQNVEILAASVSGGPVRPLTSGKTWSIGPRAGGHVVVFQRFAADGPHLWCMDRDGSDAHEVIPGSGQLIETLSPDGRTAAVFDLDSTGALPLVSIDTGTRRWIPGVDVALEFFADGRRLLAGRAVTDEHGIAKSVWEVLPVDGGPPTDSLRLPDNAAEPALDADGRGMSYLNAADHAWNVYRMDFGGGRPRAVTRFGEGRILDHRWAPGGQRLAVVRQIGGDANVWITGPDGGHPLQVTRFEGQEVFRTRWLRDGEHLAVQAGTSSRDAVILRGLR